MLSQEWGANKNGRMGNREDAEIHTEPSTELLSCGMAGNGVRVCHHVDWTQSSQTILYMKMANGKEATIKVTFKIKNLSL